MFIPRLAFLCTLALYTAACHGQTRQAALRDTEPSRQTPGGAITSFANVVENAAPAVVTVRSRRRVSAPEAFPFQHPFFRDFFGPFGAPEEPPRGRLRRGLGSGVIVRSDGHCLTNHHVVDGADEIQLELGDGRRFPAKLVGTDPPTDLALVKIDAGGLPVLPLGDSDAVRVGDVALALGNPLGVGQSVTMGIISAKNRTTGLGEGTFEDFLQTDAPINQGNSGGALVNTSGELIGINSQIVSVSGGNIGIGFAIPSNMARTVMEHLLESGQVRRGQLGVSIQELTPEIAEGLGISGVRGVLVNSVTAGSPAETAGIQRGDVITALNGEAVEDVHALRNRIAAAAPGTEVTLSLRREERDRDVRVRLGELTLDRRPGQSAPATGQGRLGIAVEPLTPEAASRMGLEAASGLVIRSLDPAGAAAEAGLQAGDVILEASRRQVRSVADLEAAVQAAAGRPVLLLVNRRGQTFYLAVEPRPARR
jgi:serine protease Do